MDPDSPKSCGVHFKISLDFPRDHNKDGYMDLEEVKAWIIPADFDHSEAESKHLIFESDADQGRHREKKCRFGSIEKLRFFSR